jgi:hypothetical protein
MSAVDQSEFHSLCILLEARGIVGVKKAKETRLTKVCIVFHSNCAGIAHIFSSIETFNMSDCNHYSVFFTFKGILVQDFGLPSSLIFM